MKTLKINLRKLNKEQFNWLKQQSINSVNLYNKALNIANIYFNETKKYIGYNELYKQIKNSDEYKLMIAKMAQQTLRLLDKDFKSFFALLQRKNKGQYGSNVSIPKAKKTKYFNLILPNDQIVFKNNQLKLSKNIKLNFKYDKIGKVKQGIIKWHGNGFNLYLSYEEIINKKNKDGEIKQTNIDKKGILSIDLGVNNLMSCYSNVGPAIIVSGKIIKSYNQFYNKRKAKIITELRTCNGNDRKWSKALSRIEENRNNYINNYFNQSIAIIYKYCFKHNIKTVVLGYNEGWKTEVNLGKKNNQKFYAIPHGILRSKLESKMQELGIECIMHEESYTSKCSFLDREKVGFNHTYLGKRIKRGLFISSNGTKYNADINGAGNIMRKVFDDKKVFLEDNDRIVGSIISPVVFNPLTRNKPIKV